MNELQAKARGNPSIQINRGHYNYRTKLYTTDEAVFEVCLKKRENFKRFQ